MYYFIANWKMYVSAAAVVPLAQEYASTPLPKNTTVVVCPDFTALPDVQKTLAAAAVLLGAQDVAPKDAAAQTGEVAAAVLKERGCSFVIVGHSERRMAGETDAIVAAKLAQTLANGLRPVLCVGEPEAVRAKNEYAAFIKEQLHAALHDVPAAAASQLLIAYEPVWAISAHASGRVITNEDIVAALILIRSTLRQMWGAAAEEVNLLYGGSVDAKNVGSILALAPAQGVLVGSASTKTEQVAQFFAALSA